jgi:hypothetical protein
MEKDFCIINQLDCNGTLKCSFEPDDVSPCNKLRRDDNTLRNVVAVVNKGRNCLRRVNTRACRQMVYVNDRSENDWRETKDYVE